jgi:hypothetical protein
MEKQIKLGQKVRDMVTNYEGIAIARVEYLNGCIQYCVKPTISQDGKMPEGEYIDYQQLEIIDNGIDTVLSIGTGGVMPDAPRNSY